MCCLSSSAERRGDSWLVRKRLLEPDRAEPQALVGDDIALFEKGQQSAAAADVGDERLTLLDAQGVAHRLADGRDGQPAFLRRVDHFDVQMRGHEDAIQEGLAVGGLADGRGGHGPDLLDLIEIEQLAEIAQHGHGGPHAVAAQASTAEGVLAQMDGPLQLLQDLDASVGKDLGNDHSQGVRPHVHGGDGFGNGRIGGLSGRLRFHDPLLFRSSAGGQARGMREIMSYTCLTYCHIVS